MEKILSYLAMAGIPFSAFQIARKASGYAGASSYTTGLSTFGGPYGMNGGVMSLLLMSIASGQLTEQAVSTIFTMVIKELCDEGESQEELFAKIDKYPVSKGLKLKLKETVRQYNALSITK